MPQLITKEITCRDCKVSFTHTTRSNRPKLLCEDCLTESQRKANREHQRRRRAGNHKVPQYLGCRDCGKDWDKPRHRAARCTECRQAANREYQRELRAAKPVPARTFTCKTCAAKIVRVGKSGIVTYCDACKPAARKAAWQRTVAKLREQRGTTMATHCAYCATKFDKPRYRARTPNRCDECKKDLHRAYVRAWWAKQPRGFDHVRRARKMGLGYERFQHIEIFDRDHWRCGICRRHIDRRLRWPHPKSVSLDHVIPLAKGGHHSRRNTQAAHLRCNLRKRTNVAPMGEQIPLFV